MENKAVYSGGDSFVSVCPDKKPAVYPSPSPDATAPQWARASSFSRLYDHTQTHHTSQESSGRVFNPMQRPLPKNTQHSQQTDINALRGSRTCNPSKLVTSYPRLRPRGHRNRRQQACIGCNYKDVLYHVILCIVVDVAVAVGGTAVASSEFPWIQRILLHRACRHDPHYIQHTVCPFKIF